MKNSIILKVTNDEYEFILDLYEDTKELAKILNIKPESVRAKIARPSKANFKYVRVWMRETNE